MDIIQIDKDITVMYVTADSFPNDVLASHQKLHSLIPLSTERNTSAFRARKVTEELFIALLLKY